MSEPVGQGTCSPVYRKITADLIRAYAAASGDFNPLHGDADVAVRAGFRGPIAHGMLLIGFVDEMLSNAFAMRWIEGGKLRVRLKAPAYVGDEVQVSGHARDGADGEGNKFTTCRVSIKNQLGEELLSGVARMRATTS